MKRKRRTATIMNCFRSPSRPAPVTGTPQIHTVPSSSEVQPSIRSPGGFFDPSKLVILKAFSSGYSANSRKRSAPFFRPSCGSSSFECSSSASTSYTVCFRIDVGAVMWVSAGPSCSSTSCLSPSPRMGAAASRAGSSIAAAGTSSPSSRCSFSKPPYDAPSVPARGRVGGRSPFAAATSSGSSCWLGPEPRWPLPKRPRAGLGLDESRWPQHCATIEAGSVEARDAGMPATARGLRCSSGACVAASCILRSDVFGESDLSTGMRGRGRKSWAA